MRYFNLGYPGLQDRIEFEHALVDDDGTVLVLCRSLATAERVMAALEGQPGPALFTRLLNDGSELEDLTREDVEGEILSEIIDDYRESRWGTVEDQEGNQVPVEITVRLAEGSGSAQADSGSRPVPPIILDAIRSAIAVLGCKLPGPILEGAALTEEEVAVAHRQLIRLLDLGEDEESWCWPFNDDDSKPEPKRWAGIPGCGTITFGEGATMAWVDTLARWTNRGQTVMVSLDNGESIDCKLIDTTAEAGPDEDLFGLVVDVLPAPAERMRHPIDRLERMIIPITDISEVHVY